MFPVPHYRSVIYHATQTKQNRKFNIVGFSEKPSLAIKMMCWTVSKHKLWLYWPLMLLMICTLMVWQTHANCTEEERKALLEIKASFIKTYDIKMGQVLPTWVDYGSSSRKDGGGDCCNWESVNCNTITGHVTELSFNSVIEDNLEFINKLWPLNFSLFLPFKELRSLSLSKDALDKEITKTGLESLSILNKLGVLDLSWNLHLDNDILRSLGTLTSLKILDLSYTSFHGNLLITEFAALENLEMLDLTGCELNGTFEIQGFETVLMLRNLRTLNLGANRFNENVIRLIASLNTLSSLTNLDLSDNQLSGPFPAQELSQLTNLEELDLSHNQLNGTPNIQVCTSLLRLKRLESINLSYNRFNNKLVSCLSSLPSLKILHLEDSFLWGSLFPVQEFHNLFDLEVLILSNNGFKGTLPVEAFTSFHHLRVLDLSGNNFVGSVPPAVQELSSLRAVSFANNDLNGSLSDHGLCELKNLQELNLGNNMLDGSMPHCFNSLSSLKFFDISSNRFTGALVPSLVANLTSLEYIDFSHNKFEGSFSFSSFSNHTKLEVVRFRNDNDKFEVETEEPMNWIPMFQLKILVLSNCNMNKRKGRVVPRFLLHQHKLLELDVSYNSLKGQFPNWIIESNTNLEVLNLRNNYFGSIPLCWNAGIYVLDVSGNHMTGSIPDHIPNFFPNILALNLSKNSLSGVIPSSLGDLSNLGILDLSDNELSGEVPSGLLTNISKLVILKLSKNKLYGDVLSGNLNFTHINGVYLDSNHFTGKIGLNYSGKKFEHLNTLDISNNFFTGIIPDWIGNMSSLSELSVRNNNLEGQFPCGIAEFTFLDISQNYFSGPTPPCSNFQKMEHLHLCSNRFTGSMPNSFRNLTNVLTLDMGNNQFSGRVPEFIGELSNLRILILRKNNFTGSIPNQLSQLSNASLIDLSKNSLSGSIPSCLQNIIGPTDLAFVQRTMVGYGMSSSYKYRSVLPILYSTIDNFVVMFKRQDEVQFTTKSMSLLYKGDILNYMAGLDLSCNKLTGQISEELGLSTQIRALNLSHNQLTGPIPVNLSNLVNIESLDLSSNGLTGEVPSELSRLTFLAVLNVSHNNLSGRLPEMKAQFGTFTKESYEGNPFLCGPPLEKNCTTEPHVTDHPSQENEEEEEEEGSEKWDDVDMTCFYGSSSSTLVVFLLGFVGVLYVNPYWRKTWLDLVEECMYICYYFVCDSVRKPIMIFRK